MPFRWILWFVMFHFSMIGAAFCAEPTAAAPSPEPVATPSYSSSLMLVQSQRSAPFRLVRPHVEATDIALYSLIAGYRTLDYLSTRRVLNGGGSEKELPQFVVDNGATFAAFEGLATAVEVGTSVWLIRHGHQRVARTFNSVSVSLGTRTVLHNYAQPISR